MNRFKRLINTADIGSRALVERYVPFLPLDVIEGLQRYRLRSIVRHAYDTVPFYRRVMDERGLRPGDFQTAADLAKLPLIDGLTVRRNVEQFTSSRYDDRSRLAFLGSGTEAGIRKFVYWDNTATRHRLAYEGRGRVVLAKLVGKAWGCRLLHVVPPEASSRVRRIYWEAQTWMPRSMGSRHFIPADQPLETVIEQLNAFRPHLGVSYGSYADQLFRFIADRQLNAAVPRVWAYGGDMLSPGGRDLMEKTFGCTIYSTYQATETGQLGFQCEHRQGFHLNIDLCAMRLVDEVGEMVPPGESGDVVISNLHNRATVLLNYRLGDRGVLASSRCSCGRSLPLLEQLEGRCSEVIYRPDGSQVSSRILFTRLKDELKHTLQSQVVQHAPGQLLWSVVPFSEVDKEALCRGLVARTRSVLGEDTEVDVELVDEIPRTPRGKFRNVVSHKCA